MREPDIHYKKLVLVCTNERDDGRDCCKNKGGGELYTKLKSAIAEIDPMVRVSRSGCLGNCISGSVVVVMPDNKWFGDVKESDIPEIVKLATGKTSADDVDILMGDEDFLGI